MSSYLERHKREIFIITALLIRCAYSYLTVTVLDGLWYPGSNGFGINYSVENEIVSSVVFILMTLFCSFRTHKNSFFEAFFLVIYVLYFIPINAAYAINNTSIAFFILTHCYFVLIVLLITESKKKYRFSIGNNKSHFNNNIENDVLGEHVLNQTPVRVVMLVVCLIFIAYKLSYNGLSFSLAIDSDYVYGTRGAYVAYRESFTGTTLSYLLSILMSLTGIIAPIYLYLSLEKRRIGGIIISVFTILCQYSISSGKGSVFFLFIVIGIYFIVRRQKETVFPQVFLISMTVLMGVFVVSYLISQRYELYFLFIRRTMYYPAWLNNMYYDFFSKGPKLLFSESAFLLQRIIPSPYGKTPLELISQTYFSGIAQAPNTGMFAEAYMQMGIIGVFVFPFIYLLFLNFSMKTYGKYGVGLSLVMAVKLALSMTNVPIFRTDFILSIVLFTFLLWFLPKLKTWRQ